MVTSVTGQAAGTDVLDVMAEIRGRTAAMRSAAFARGMSLLPPLLMLGTSERVGSNWLSDTLRPASSPMPVTRCRRLIRRRFQPMR